VKSYKTAALKAKKEGNKKDAIELLKKSKELDGQISLLQNIRDHPSKPAAPTVKVEEVEKEIERVNKDVGPNELKLSVESMTGLMLAGYTQLNCYVYAEVKMLEEGVMTKVQSNPVAGSDPKMDFECAIPIERNRATARFFEKKKLTIQVYHRRGALLKDVLVGRFILDLSPLLNKVESEQDCPVLRIENKRPLTPNSSAHVVVKLFKPLLGKDVVKIKEKTIVFDPPLEMPKDVPAAKPAPAPTSKGAAAAAPAPVPASKGAAPAQPAAKPASAPAPAAAGGAVAELLEKAEDPARYVSLEVLQYELDQSKAKLAAAKKAKKPSGDLEMRAEMLQESIETLTMNVDIGILSPEQYVASLKKAVIEEKQLATQLNHAGQKEAALDCLRRKKMMEKELKEMEENQ